MARSKRRRRTYADDLWVGLPIWMVRSPAWKSLSANAVRVLIEIWTKYNGRNNGHIPYGCREGKSVGLGKDSVGRAILELVDKCFLVCTRGSSFTLKTREAREWRITALPSGYNQEIGATKDFMRWGPKTEHSRSGETYSRAGANEEAE